MKMNLSLRNPGLMRVGGLGVPGVLKVPNNILDLINSKI